MNCKFTEFQRFDNKNSAAFVKIALLSQFDRLLFFKKIVKKLL